MQLLLSKITFTYEGAANPLFEDVTVQFPEGWTGIVGANGMGKTTLMRLACGGLEPQRGSVRRPGRVVYCPQRTDDLPALFDEFISAADGTACALRGRLRIQDEWLGRWDTLSHGERKRSQIAVALWQEPDVLAVDEPTNHIDADARHLLTDALASFKGVGLLVSHDRELLDSLCEQSLFVEPPSVVMRAGGYTSASEQARMEAEHMQEEYRQAKEAASKVIREAARRRQDASRANRQRSKRGLAPGDHDAKGKIDMARFSGADGNAGRLARQLDGRVRQAQSKVEEFQLKRDFDLNFWLPGSRCPRRVLFDIPAGEIGLGEARSLSFPQLYMLPTDRVAIVGPNGAGKSTLIRHIMGSLSLPEGRVICLPQEIDQEGSRRIMSEVNSLPHAELGTVMNIVSCLGTRPDRLIGSTESSPGEIRKILLALGVARSPYLIVMDEPTNHLDLPAIELLEQALSGCPCGLLLVSHDRRFLASLTDRRWVLTPVEGGSGVRLVEE